MNNRLFVWSCCVMTFFVACQQAEVENPEADDLRMSVVASIGSPKDAFGSRYAGDDPMQVDFETSDAIGVFVDGTLSSKWTYGTSGWTSETLVYWPDKTGEHTFYAFYPYADAVSADQVSMPSLLNQTGTIAGISQCDFLVADVEQSYGLDGVVNFQGEHSFTHVSTLLQLTFKGDGDLSSSTINKIMVEGINLVAPSTYSFTSKSVALQPDEQSDVLEAELNQAMDGQDRSFYFIVNEKTDATSTVTLAIEYSSGGKTYVAQMENFANNTFVGGMRQSYTFIIKDSSLIISGSSISAWGEGEQMDDVVINGEERPA